MKRKGELGRMKAELKTERRGDFKFKVPAPSTLLTEILLCSRLCCAEVEAETNFFCVERIVFEQAFDEARD